MKKKKENCPKAIGYPQISSDGAKFEPIANSADKWWERGCNAQTSHPLRRTTALGTGLQRGGLDFAGVRRHDGVALVRVLARRRRKSIRSLAFKHIAAAGSEHGHTGDAGSPTLPLYARQSRRTGAAHGPT